MAAPKNALENIADAVEEKLAEASREITQDRPVPRPAEPAPAPGVYSPAQAHANAAARPVVESLPKASWLGKPRADTQQPPMVDHPLHYNSHPSGVECITVTEHFNFNRGNAIKYIWRAGMKDGKTEVQDLEKARWYLDREIQRLKGAK